LHVAIAIKFVIALHAHLIAIAIALQHLVPGDVTAALIVAGARILTCWCVQDVAMNSATIATAIVHGNLIQTSLARAIVYSVKRHAIAHAQKHARQEVLAVYVKSMILTFSCMLQDTALAK
jgi:hypothetical protein